MKIDYSTCGSHGFRMCGFSSFERDKRIFIDKYFGRQLKAEGLSEMFSKYFQYNPTPVEKMITKID